jgi:hypothetical protein
MAQECTTLPQTINVPLDVLQAITEAAYWPVLLERLCLDEGVKGKHIAPKTRERQAELKADFMRAEGLSRHQPEGRCTPTTFTNALIQIFQEKRSPNS